MFSLSTYKTFDAIAVSPLRSSEGVPRSIYRPLEWLDAGTGVVSVDSRLPYSRFNTDSVMFEVSGRAQVWAFRQWLYSIKGRSKTFWLPTFAQDLTLTTPAGAADTNLTIARVDYTSVRSQPGHKHLAFQVNGGAPIFREVLDSAVAGGEEVVQLDAALGVTAGVSTVISFMPLVRLAGDRVELNWLDSEQIACTFSVRGVAA